LAEALALALALGELELDVEPEPELEHPAAPSDVDRLLVESCQQSPQ
jgi:hypothetical protein